MKYILLVFCLTLFTVTTLQAQKKSELIAQIDDLESQLNAMKSEVSKSRNNEKIAAAQSESFQTQVTELQDANTTLMQNLNSFAEVSNKKSNTVTSAMASLEAKENQLKLIKNTISSNDSTTIVILTNAKQTMGENVKIGVSEGKVIISSKLQSLFGSDTGTTLAPAAEAWVEKIANVLTANPTTGVTIEGLSMTGDLNVPAQQAAALSAILQSKFAIAAERITTLGRDGNLREGIQISIHPKFDQFYLMVREEMKN